MATRNVYDFGDVLRHSETLGYFWNQAHDILTKDDMPPPYDMRGRVYHISDFKFEDQEDLYDYSEETCRICTSFMESKDITEMMVL